MRLTYTVEIELSAPLFGRDDEDASAELMRLAFEQVGSHVGSRRVEHLAIFPHDDSRPAGVPDDTHEDLGIPDEVCPTCGVPQFSRSVDG